MIPHIYIPTNVKYLYRFLFGTNLAFPKENPNNIITKNKKLVNNNKQEKKSKKIA